MRLKACLLLLVVGVIQNSCSNDSDPGMPNVSAFASLTEKYFIRESVTSDPAYPLGNGTSTTDIYHDWYKGECVLDDLRMFKANGDYIYENGATKCDPVEDQLLTFEWQFLADSVHFWINKGHVNDTMKILLNDGVTLKYENKVRFASQNYVWTKTWKKK